MGTRSYLPHGPHTQASTTKRLGNSLRSWVSGTCSLSSSPQASMQAMKPARVWPCFTWAVKVLTMVSQGLVEAPGDAFVHQDFHVALGLADKNQHPGVAHGVVQVLLQEPSRQVWCAPVAHRAGIR